MHSFRAGLKAKFKACVLFFIIFFHQIRNPESEQHEQKKEFYFAVSDGPDGQHFGTLTGKLNSSETPAKDFVSPDLFCREHMWLPTAKPPAAAISY